MIISNYDFQARKDLEAAILGALLIDSDRFEFNLLEKHGLDSKEYFCTEFHQDLFERIQKCIKNGLAVDLVTISNFKQDKYIDSNKPFDFEAIRITQRISSSAHLEYHLMIHKQYILMDYWNNKSSDILDSYWNTRDVLQVSDNIIDSYNILYEKLTKYLEKIVANNEDGRRALLNKWEQVQNGIPISIPTGITKLDNEIGGFFNGEFTIFAGRPGMGKTSLALLLCRKASYEKEIEGHFYTLEMPKKQLQNRVIAHELGIDKEDIRKLNLDFATMQKVLDRYEWMDNVSKLKVIDDCRTITKIKKRIAKERPKYVMIDYLQLIKFDDNKSTMKVGNREQEISAISRELKNISVEFDIPIIALSQLSRGVDARVNKRPMLSDLRESGSLEQDSDNVVFFFRPAYYAEKEGQKVPEHEQGNLEYIISKGRETGIKTYYISVDFVSSTLFNFWFDHNNSEEFYENRQMLKRQEMKIAPPPPPLSET